MRWSWSFVLFGFAFGCGSAPPAESPGPASAEPLAPEPAPVPASSEAPREAVEQSPKATTRDVPKECAVQDSCVPPERFSHKVCQGKFPSLALVMMEKSSPWQHRFISDEWLEPINAYGGPSSENWLRYGEEVVLLKGSSEYSEKDIKVTGPDDVDILRADGTCATVTEKALSERSPGVSKSAPIIWKYLEEPMREALLQNKQVANAQKKQKADCKGSSATHPTPQCKRASGLLNQAIMQVLKAGIELPLPEKRPEWEAGTQAHAEEAKNE